MTSRAKQGGFSTSKTPKQKPSTWTLTICPSCGYWKRLLDKTGFCQTCTNELERGGAVT